MMRHNQVEGESMLLGSRIAVLAICAFPAFAQFTSPPQDFVTYFEYRAEPGFPPADLQAGFARVTRKSNDRSFSIVHRYFFEEASHTYFGYDFEIRSDPKTGAYQLNFAELSIGPLEFQGVSEESLDTSRWKKQPLPGMPVPHVAQPNETVDTTVFVDMQSGQKLIDSVRIVLRPQFIRQAPPPAAVPGRGPAIPSVDGDARSFSIEDAELHLQQSRLTLNGSRQQFDGAAKTVNGALVWVYIPHRGRYVVSLTPRASLGFTKAGEVRGGTLRFTVGKDEVLLESPIAIAPGEAAYVVYVLHDPAWAPTSQVQRANPLVGSVSVRELEVLK
jgi:hypothetical protein